MDVDYLSTTAQNAFMAIPFKGITPMKFPLLMIRGYLATSPKVALRAHPDLAQVAIGTFSGTCRFLVAWESTKDFIADWACFLLLSVAPSGSEVALVRTVLGYLSSWVNIERVGTVHAGYVSPLFFSTRKPCSFESFVPRFMAWLRSIARRGTVLAFSGTFELYAACNTGVNDCFHRCILPHVWLLSKYIELSHDRIAKSQPLLFEVTA